MVYHFWGGCLLCLGSPLAESTGGDCVTIKTNFYKRGGNPSGNGGTKLETTLVK